METDNHNLSKNVTTNEKYIPRKMGLKFCRIAFYIYFVLKFEPFGVQDYEGPKRPFWDK